MTKEQTISKVETLTEQWKNGTLPFGMYYVKTTDGNVRTDETVYLVWEKQYRWRYTDFCCVEEVISPVPTYFEQAKLYVENRDLKEENENLHSVKNELLTRCHKLREQLKEANELLLGFLDENICSFDHNGYCQEHSSPEPDYRCIQQQLKWYFKKHEVLNDVSSHCQ